MPDIGPNNLIPEQLPESADRLNGWSDVARYVAKSIRTAQRWEKDLGLPVHRITTPNGDIVYAFRTEIDAWARNRDTKADGAQTSVDGERGAGNQPASGAHQTMVRPRLRAGLMVGLGIGGAGFALVFALHAISLAFFGRPDTPQPARHVASSGAGPAGWDVVENRLRVFGAHDDRLWEYKFPFPLDERAYLRNDTVATPPVAMVDLENDGAKEVLFVAHALDPVNSGLFCFDANGAIRFLVRPRHRARFGDIEYPVPFEVQQFIVTEEANRNYAIWLVAADRDWFPTVLLKLTHTGDAIAEFWNDGHIDLVREAHLGMRRVMLVAGGNEEYRGPGVAILDYDAPGGSAPADDERYQCRNCGSGRPLAAVVVPFTSVWSEIQLAPHIDDLLLSQNGYVMLTLHGHRSLAADASGRFDVLCTFDERLAMVDVQMNGRAASAQALTNTSTTELEPDSRLRPFPVLRWVNGEHAAPTIGATALPSASARRAK